MEIQYRKVEKDLRIERHPFLPKYFILLFLRKKQLKSATTRKYHLLLLLSWEMTAIFVNKSITNWQYSHISNIDFIYCSENRQTQTHTHTHTRAGCFSHLLKAC